MNKSKTIFIVDDDEMFSQLLMGHLSKNKLFNVSYFPTGEALLNEISQDPDVIVLDYSLNTVDKNAANGLDILEQIKKMGLNSHIIMLSSQSKYGVAAFSISKGAEQYVIKDESAFDTIYDIVQSLEKK